MSKKALLNWIELDSVSQLEEICSISQQAPVLIFKHSTRCEISAIAKYRLEDDWEFDPNALKPYFLDLIRHRDVSAQVATHFEVHHESPQVLLISKGSCIYDASHLDIQVSDLKLELG